jgi:hypothetical protein
MAVVTELLRMIKLPQHKTKPPQHRKKLRQHKKHQLSNLN